jgi:hypothetical protein
MTDFTRRDFGQALLAGGVLAHCPWAERGLAIHDVRERGIARRRAGHSRRALHRSAAPDRCTAILFDPDAAAGVDYATSAPGEAGAVLLQPSSPVDEIHALFLTGGGPFGLPGIRRSDPLSRGTQDRLRLGHARTSGSRSWSAR